MSGECEEIVCPYSMFLRAKLYVFRTGNVRFCVGKRMSPLWKNRINKYVFLSVCLVFQMFFRIFRKELLAGSI